MVEAKLLVIALLKSSRLTQPGAKPNVFRISLEAETSHRTARNLGLSRSVIEVSLSLATRIVGEALISIVKNPLTGKPYLLPQPLSKSSQETPIMRCVKTDQSVPRAS